MNRKAIDLAVLQRDVENAKAVYDNLAAAGTTSGRLRRPQHHQQRSHRRQSGRARSADQPEAKTDSADGAARRRCSCPSAWRSSSSTSTPASRRRRKSKFICASTLWARFHACRGNRRERLRRTGFLTPRAIELRRGLSRSARQRPVLVSRCRPVLHRRDQRLTP